MRGGCVYRNALLVLAWSCLDLYPSYRYSFKLVTIHLQIWDNGKKKVLCHPNCFLICSAAIPKSSKCRPNLPHSERCIIRRNLFQVHGKTMLSVNIGGCQLTLMSCVWMVKKLQSSGSLSVIQHHTHSSRAQFRSQSSNNSIVERRIHMSGWSSYEQASCNEGDV